MDDLIERLREQARYCEMEERLDLLPDADLMREAATEIEKLRAALKAKEAAE